MRFLGILLLASGVAFAQDCDTSACGPEAAATDCESLGADLKSAQREILVARGEFKRLARVEQQALKEARKDVFKKSAQGQAMAPAFSAAADLLEATAAAEKDKKVATLCADMAASYRAMAKALDRREKHLAETLREKKPTDRAGETYKQALEKLQQPATEDKNTAASWRLVKKGDPRYRAFARNMKSLQASFAAVDGVKSAKGKACVAGAQKLNSLLQVHFDGVATERPPPPPALVPT